MAAMEPSQSPLNSPHAVQSPHWLELVEQTLQSRKDRPIYYGENLEMISVLANPKAKNDPRWAGWLKMFLTHNQPSPHITAEQQDQVRNAIGEKLDLHIPEGSNPLFVLSLGMECRKGLEKLQERGLDFPNPERERRLR